MKLILLVPDTGGQKIPFQYIAIFNDNVVSNTISLRDAFQALDTIVESLGGEIIFTYETTLAGFTFKAPDQPTVDVLLPILRTDPRIKYVEQDQIVVPFSEYVPRNLYRIEADPPHPNPDTLPTYVDSDIAVIDSGIDLDHPDLNVYANLTTIVPQEAASRSISLIASDIDVKKVHQYLNDTAANTPRLYPPFSHFTTTSGDDNCGHGTHVSGIIAAKHNSLGVVGIAPGAKPLVYKSSRTKSDY